MAAGVCRVWDGPEHLNSERMLLHVVSCCGGSHADLGQLHFPPICCALTTDPPHTHFPGAAAGAVGPPGQPPWGPRRCGQSCDQCSGVQVSGDHGGLLVTWVGGAGFGTIAPSHGTWLAGNGCGPTHADSPPFHHFTGTAWRNIPSPVLASVPLPSHSQTLQHQPSVSP